MYYLLMLWVKHQHLNLLILKEKILDFVLNCQCWLNLKNINLFQNLVMRDQDYRVRKKVNEFKDGFLILLCILKMFIFRK